MTRSLRVLVFSLLVFSVAIGCNSENQLVEVKVKDFSKLQLSDFSIHGIQLERSKESLLGEFGEPVSIESYRGRSTLDFGSFSVDLDESGRVTQIYGESLSIRGEKIPKNLTIQEFGKIYGVHNSELKDIHRGFPNARLQFSDGELGMVLESFRITHFGIQRFFEEKPVTEGENSQ